MLISRVAYGLVGLVVFGACARADVISADNLHGAAKTSGYFIGVGYTDNLSYVNEAAAQEFVAQVGGKVSTLLATVDNFDAGTIPLTVGIRSKTGGTVGALLGQVVVAPGSVPSIPVVGFNSFDLSGADIELIAGESYYATFTTTNPLVSDVRYRANLQGNPAYPFGHTAIYSKNGGGTWQVEPVPYEIGLTVSVVPSPTAAMTGAPMAAAAVLMRRRRVVRVATR